VRVARELRELGEPARAANDDSADRLPKEKTIPPGFIVAVSYQEALNKRPELFSSSVAWKAQPCTRNRTMLRRSDWASPQSRKDSGDKVHTHAAPGSITLPNAA
jgi:hypothetical protein